MRGKIVVTTCNQMVIASRWTHRWTGKLVRLMLTIGLPLSFVWTNVGSSQLALADSIAQAPAPPQLTPDLEPVDLKALEPGNTPDSVVTEKTISQTELTLPSLWWVKEQFAAHEKFGGKLLEDWLAYPHQSNQPGRIDFVINRQLWSLLDYLDRYAFIHEFGSAARDYGYNIRVFDREATFLGSSTCDFSAINLVSLKTARSRQPSGDSQSFSNTTAIAPTQPPPATDAIVCSISLDSTGKAGFSGRSNPLGAEPAK